MSYIGDANDPATILCDADTFFSSYFADTDGDEAMNIVNDLFKDFLNPGPNFEKWGRLTAALVQVYDLVLPFDGARAACYLQRLGAIAATLLANRDDMRGSPADFFRGRVMPAWGHFTPDRDEKWNTDVVTSGLFVYAMAAFARRVAEHPVRYAQHQANAICFITEVINTYLAFRRDELHLVEGDRWAYFNNPEAYKGLKCVNGDSGTRKNCGGYLDQAGKPIAFNENLAMMQALAECALAADSALYRGSADATAENLSLATEEMPLVVEKNVAFFVGNLDSKTLSDGTPYYDGWKSVQFPPNNEPDIEGLSHAGFLLGCLAVILGLQMGLNSLLARAGRAERIPFSNADGIGFTNLFLRKVWRSDNTLSDDLKGSPPTGDRNSGCAGWIPYAQFDQWVWRRSRDTTFYYPHATPPDLNEANHGALLRYREFNSNSIKYLRDFAGQNWVITPAPLAAGESRPTSIRDQKWLLVLSGVVIADLRGEDGEWGHQTVSFMPDMSGPDDPDSTSGPLNWAINRYSIPKPAGSPGMDYLIRFSLEEWPPFVSPSAMFNESQAMNCGFAVDLWRPSHFGSGTES